MRRSSAAAVWMGSLLMLLSSVIFADDAMDWADQEAALGVQRLLLPVRINTVPTGEAVVLIDEADGVLVRAADFQQWATGLTAEVSALVGESWVILDSLSPALIYRIDLTDLVLDVTVQPTYFGTRSISLLTGPPPGLRFLRDLSSFFNYSVAVRDGDEYYGAAELGTTIGPGLLLGNVTIDSNGIRRNLAQYVVDWPSRRQRLIAGDYPIAGDALTGGGIFTGVRFGRDFEIDPYFFRYPAPDFQAVVETPSTIEIYSEGRLIRREQVGPGVIDLQNLQTSAGQGVADIVIVDAFGRRTDLAASFYIPITLLGEGVSDYQLSLGAPRLGFGSEEYGDLTADVRYRRGLTDRLTAGGLVQAREDRYVGGGTASLSTPFGEFQAIALGSEDRALGSGAAGALNYRLFARNGLGLTLGGRLTSDDFRTAGATETSLPKWEMLGSIAYQFGPVSISASGRKAEYDDGERSLVQIFTSTRLSRRVQLIASGSRSDGQLGSEDRFFVGASIYLDQGITVGLGGEHASDTTTARIDLQRSRSIARGFDYRVAASSSKESESITAYGEYNGDHGRYSALVDNLEGGTVTELRAAGGVVMIGGAAHWTRPVEDSFLLVRMPELPNVRILANNLEIGRTNESGELLLPNLRAYHANRISFDDQDVPLGFAFDEKQALVAPPYRGGGTLEFEVRRIQAVTGHFVLEIDGSRRVPAFGTARTSDAESVIGEGGEFYFETLPPGSHRVEVETDVGRCATTIQVAESEEFILDLQEVVCSGEALP